MMGNTRLGKNRQSVINFVSDSDTGSNCQLDRFFFKTVVRRAGDTFIGYSVA
jgi:hypothetical protein